MVNGLKRSVDEVSFAKVDPDGDNDFSVILGECSKVCSSSKVRASADACEDSFFCNSILDT